MHIATRQLLCKILAQPHFFDSELQSQINFLKKQSNAPLTGKLETYIKSLGSFLFNNDTTEVREQKNWIRLHEMELRGSNPFLDALKPPQKKTLCTYEEDFDFFDPVKALGSGQSGVVDKVRIGDLPCALKKADDVKIDFLQGKEFVHPDIVKVWMMVEKKSGDYLFMEYLPGETLKRKYEKLEPKEMLRYAAKLVAINADLRSIGRAHRDLHAGNIMISNGSVKLIDVASLRKVSNSTREIAMDIRHLLSDYRATRRFTIMQCPFDQRIDSIRERLLENKKDDKKLDTILAELTIDHAKL